LAFSDGSLETVGERIGAGEEGGWGERGEKRVAWQVGSLTGKQIFSVLVPPARDSGDLSSGRENTGGFRFAKYFAGQRITVGWPR
jgi:hypothetical protein